MFSSNWKSSRDFDPNKTLTNNTNTHYTIQTKKTKFHALMSHFLKRKKPDDGASISSDSTNVYDDAMTCLCFQCPKCMAVYEHKNELLIQEELEFITQYY